MYCPQCGTQNVDANKFCTKCGAALGAQLIQPGADQPATNAPPGSSVPPPGNQLYGVPMVPGAQTYYAQRPPKDRSVAMILEILPGLFGFLGFGWIYSGNTSMGITWLIGFLIWDLGAVVIDVLSGGFGCFCTVPISLIFIAVSASSLSKYTRQHPELFG